MWLSSDRIGLDLECANKNAARKGGSGSSQQRRLERGRLIESEIAKLFGKILAL